MTAMGIEDVDYIEQYSTRMEGDVDHLEKGTSKLVSRKIEDLKRQIDEL
jgi:hypothetical protein